MGQEDGSMAETEEQTLLEGQPMSFYGMPKAELFAALAVAQGETMAALKETEGQVGQAKRKYADLSSCWDACRDKLARNGLCIIQIPSADGPRVSVTTIIGHKSGQEISGTLTLVSAVTTPQGVGSAITYARRYGLCAMVGISPEDDDGALASGAGPKAQGTRAEGVAAAKQLAEQKVAALKGGATRHEAEAISADQSMEQQLEDSVKAAGPSKLFSVLGYFAECKADLGDEAYYRILAANGYKKSNEITSVDVARKIYKEMRLEAKPKEIE